MCPGIEWSLAHQMNLSGKNMKLAGTFKDEEEKGSS
jgi:hypothetical protein